MVEQVPAFTGESLVALAQRIGEPVQLVARKSDGALGLAQPGWLGCRDSEVAVVARLPALYPEWLGDQEFTRTHGTRFPYVAGEMANGISGTALVSEMARAEMLAFLGSAGLSVEQLECALAQLSGQLGGRRNWGANLIHRPDSAAMEDATAAVLLRAGVPRISVSAFMTLTPAVVRCAATGLRRDASGRVQRGAAVFAKVSRPEVAEQFMSPAPTGLLRLLVGRGQLTADEARLAELVPVAEDVTVEADSGGHTDGRPLGVVLPEVLALRDALHARLGLERPVRVGAAGGLGDPAAVAAAFALGAAYVVTGTVNQMSVEAAISERAKALLAEARVTDVAMAPSGGLFEIGSKVQVLRRGTLFAARAVRLHRLYERYPSLEALSDETRAALEREVLGLPVAEVWEATRAYWSARDPAVIARAEADPRHRMALVFRWYLGSSSLWAIEGRADRVADYQVWCSPAAGAFNRWTAGSFLAEPAARTVVQIARNLMQGAAVVTRVHQLRTFGLRLPHEAFAFRPRPLV